MAVIFIHISLSSSLYLVEWLFDLLNLYSFDTFIYKINFRFKIFYKSIKYFIKALTILF
jgi:hypothetical protein